MAVCLSSRCRSTNSTILPLPLSYSYLLTLTYHNRSALALALGLGGDRDDDGATVPYHSADHPQARCAFCIVMSSNQVPSMIPSVPGVSTSSVAQPPDEDSLRVQLRTLFSQLKKREPLEPTYKRLLTGGVVTARKPALPKDKFYRRIGSRLRERVERFCMENEGKDPFDRLRRRKPLDDEKMRAAFTLREHKDHEQKPLLEAHMASLPKRQAMTEEAARRHLEGVALGLQNLKWRKKQVAMAPSGTNAPVSSVVEQTEAARQAAELERQRKEAQAREQARQRRLEEEETARARREEMLERQSRRSETPNQVLQKMYTPLFEMLWNLEFDNLQGQNPFRMVIDRNNCALINAADYFDIIEKPMNLTWIKEKVERSEYNTLKEFFADVELMISNALKYNSHETNPYRIAALELKTKWKREAIKLVKVLRSKQGS